MISTRRLAALLWKAGWLGFALLFGALAAEWSSKKHVAFSNPHSKTLLQSTVALQQPMTVTQTALAAAPRGAIPPSSLNDDKLDLLGANFGHGKIITGGTPHRLILFTFDDGPDWRTTPDLLDRLDEKGIKALFFLSGWRLQGPTFRAQQQAAIAQQILARGHFVGNHTVHHSQLPLFNNATIQSELEESEVLFEQLFGQRAWLFRPPGGAYSERTQRLIAERGYTTVLWNLGTGDFQVRSAQQVLWTFKKVLERRQRENGERGGIVLLHDTHAWSVEAFELIYNELMTRNCALLHRGEELYDVVSDLKFFYVPQKDALALEHAPPATLSAKDLMQRQAKVRAETLLRCQAFAQR